MLAEGDAAVGLACVDGILPWVSSVDEPGVIFPSFMTRNSVQHNSGVALVRLCSDPRLARAAIPAVHGAEDEGGQLMPSAKFGIKVLAGMVVEARTRLALLCAAGFGGEGANVERVREARCAVQRRLDQVVWPEAFAEATEYLII